MENSTMNDRIAELIKFLELSPTAFADEIGIQRSGLSHILKGRNKPSLDMVQKIVTRFPDINLGWLVNGAGNISSSTPSVINLRQKQSSSQPREFSDPFRNTLFDTEEPVQHQREVVQEIKSKVFTHDDFVVKDMPPPPSTNPENDVIPPTKTMEIPPLPGNTAPAGREKNISKILIFYNDNTFEEFSR